MKPSAPSAADAPPPPPEPEAPQVPGFRTWRGVYAFVLGALVVYIVVFAAVPRWFR